MDIQQIMKLLPHRYPFLLIDRVLECNDNRIVAIKNVTINEPYFQGHFGEIPVMPGVLQIEAMAQAGGIILIRKLKDVDIIPYFIAIDNARFRRVVKPGDQLRIEIDVLNIRSRVVKFKGVCLVDNQISCEAELMCMIGEKKE